MAFDHKGQAVFMFLLQVRVVIFVLNASICLVECYMLP